VTDLQQFDYSTLSEQDKVHSSAFRNTQTKHTPLIDEKHAIRQKVKSEALPRTTCRQHPLRHTSDCIAKLKNASIVPQQSL